MSILNTDFRGTVVGSSINDIPDDVSLSLLDVSEPSESDDECSNVITALHDVITEKMKEIQKLNQTIRSLNRRVETLKNIIKSSSDPSCAIRVLDFL